jgi:hypothetical protein
MSHAHNMMRTNMLQSCNICCCHSCSVDPNEGISVMFDPATTNRTTTLDGAGLAVVSEIRVCVLCHALI